MENRGLGLVIINGVFFFISLIFLLIRCFVRLFIVKKFSADDYFIILGTSFFALSASFSTVAVKYGLGQHLRDIEIQNASNALKYLWLCCLFYYLATVAARVTVCWFMLTVAVNSHQIIIYFAITAATFSGIFLFSITVFQCGPISSFWDKTQIGVCIEIDFMIMAAILYSVAAIISDLVTVTLSAYTIWKLQLDTEKKLLLIPAVSMGCVSSIAVIARLPALVKLKSPDILWDAIDVVKWSTVEQGLAVTACSISSFWSLRSRPGDRTRPADMESEMSPIRLPIATPDDHTPLHSPTFESAGPTVVNSPESHDMNYSSLEIDIASGRRDKVAGVTDVGPVGIFKMEDIDQYGYETEMDEFVHYEPARCSSSVLYRNMI